MNYKFLKPKPSNLFDLNGRCGKFHVINEDDVSCLYFFCQDGTVFALDEEFKKEDASPNSIKPREFLIRKFIGSNTNSFICFPLGEENKMVPESTGYEDIHAIELKTITKK